MFGGGLGEHHQQANATDRKYRFAAFLQSVATPALLANDISTQFCEKKSCVVEGTINRNSQVSSHAYVMYMILLSFLRKGTLLFDERGRYNEDQNPISRCLNVPTIIPLSRKAFLSSQQVSGSNAQAWQAARLRESRPWPSLMIQTGSLEQVLAELTAFIKILGNASGRP